MSAERAVLAGGLEIHRLPVGLWQVSGAHGPIDPRRAVADLDACVDDGFTTLDLADHYGPAEDFVGELRRRRTGRLGAGGMDGVVAMTKWVPEPGPMTRAVVSAAVDVSRRRMGVEALDVLQFHWWDYRDERWLDALRHLADLRAEGRLRHLALTNFDTEHVERIVAEGVPIVSNQVQYSLVDRRPERRMAAACERLGVALLAYGTLGGGLLTDRWLGRAEPGRSELRTASLQKYKRMVDAWGGWERLQRLLAALAAIAAKHRSTVASVAVRAVLDRTAVAGVIVGARLGESEHRAENRRVFALALDDDDRRAIDEASAGARDLMAAIGDCGDEYR